jgi:hypothetical protein
MGRHPREDPLPTGIAPSCSTCEWRAKGVPAHEKEPGRDGGTRRFRVSCQCEQVSKDIILVSAPDLLW